MNISSNNSKTQIPCGWDALGMGDERFKTPSWWLIFGGALLTLATTNKIEAMCPFRCHCNDNSLQVTCKSAALEVVPIQLNPEVRHIDLSWNKITKMHFTLSFYNNLIFLDLSFNKIQTLGSMNFEAQHNLKHLNLSNNDVKSLSKDSFKGLRALVELDLSFNRLEKLFAPVFRELHSLRVLRLTGNQIDYLEINLFKSSKHLIQLFLDDNQLLNVPWEALIDTVHLEFLSLSRNLIASVEEGQLQNLVELKVLFLNKNVIRSLHSAALSGLGALENLDISDNNFTSVPTLPLAKLSNLTKLRFSGNFIETIPPVAFRGLFQLKFLHLDRLELLNRIDSRAFVDNINLEKVWLDDNIGLNDIPTRLFHGNPRVTQISIRNNGLTTLDASHFPIDRLKRLNLGDNPLQCNCSLLWLWKLIEEQASVKTSNKTDTEMPTFADDFIMDIEDIRCAGPEPLINVLLVDATESEIGCSYKMIATLSAVASGFLLLITASIVVNWGPPKIRRWLSCCFYGSENAHDQSETNVDQLTAAYNDPRNGNRYIIGSSVINKDYRSLPPCVWNYQGRVNGVNQNNTTETTSTTPTIATTTTRNVYKNFEPIDRSRPHIVYV